VDDGARCDVVDQQRARLSACRTVEVIASKNDLTGSIWTKRFESPSSARTRRLSSSKIGSAFGAIDPNATFEEYRCAARDLPFKRSFHEASFADLACVIPTTWIGCAD
jgi:hypothetical protein